MDGSIKRTVIAKSESDNPRNDTASVAELGDGRLMVVWHKYASGSMGGDDFGVCRIFSKISHDRGLTWGQERMLVDALPDDLNVQAPALCMLPSGELLLICLRAHSERSTSMMLFRSQDGGNTFVESSPIWERSEGQWLQGGASSLVRLSNGRLLLPFHGGTGHQFSQHNVVRCFYSDDDGYTWKLAEGMVDLPMRGAMESSVAELGDGKLVMSLRTQLGSAFLSYSEDRGETWTLAQTSGLKAPESCTCLRRIPGTDSLLLIWNDSLYDPGHHHYGERSPLSMAISDDGGNTWQRAGNIEPPGDSEYTNIDCTFISTEEAVITYMAVSPAFRRTGIDLRAAVCRIP
jgi:sialidase-1